MPRIPADSIAAALAHLQAADPVLYKVMAQVGPCRIRLESNRFRSLVRAIVSQQISTRAARSIYARVEALVAPEPISAAALARVELTALREAGLSGQKVSYVTDLAEKVLSGEVKLRALSRLTDDEVIEQLTQVKGIGRWTAQMFLIFSLGRMDVFAHDDFGIRGAIRNLYGLPELPDKATSLRIAEAWRPYTSVASWYCWRSHDLLDTLVE